MTSRELRRKHLLWVIDQWMRRHGAWFVFALFFLVSVPSSAAEETKKTVKPTSLLQILSDKDLTAAIAPNEGMKEVKKAPSPVAVVEQKKSEEPKKKDEKTVERTVKGIVNFIRKNKMAVEFAATEAGGEEILLAIGKDVKVSRAKTFSDIAQGDKVEVRYIETYRESKEKGGQPFVLSMVVKEITLVSKARPLNS